MRRGMVLLSLVAATLAFAALPTVAMANCSAGPGCPNVTCSDCDVDDVCIWIYEHGFCYCSLPFGVCIPHVNCIYGDCLWADGGRMDCPLQPFKSVAVPERRDRKINIQPIRTPVASRVL